ncbi:Uncharacterised protein (plasmid) [Mycoplasmopsis gallopavonis]|uniref:Uncharacterized protein n=1 Tax=Mycoplasmopsis gallopavonis TaxID=76629 RepID=A0A449B0D8_9BACT|nr:DUF6037 family protein [Mycoplasmopsis gallopavonis]VEU73187.1 Uncharacterised protein [Mycoplasmopsis gallopavonis]
MRSLENLKKLKLDMEEKERLISSFIFKYKEIKYIVLVERFTEEKQKKNKFALLKLNFIDDSEKELVCEANSCCLLLEAREIREYFKIEYKENIGDILRQFSKYFGSKIPTKMKENHECSDEERVAIVKKMSNKDSEDPNKKYCIGIRRNPKGQKRSIYNSEKTYILREKLYTWFEKDNTISFCYSKVKEEEKTDKEIIENFAKKENLK